MKGLFHIYTGEGKGKSTAALGLVLRAYGQGFKVFYCQFLKSGKSGELCGLKNLQDRVYVLESCVFNGFISRMSPAERDEAAAAQRQLFAQAVDLAVAGDYDLVVFDEAAIAYHLDVLSKEAVQDFILHRPEKMELVFTGRNAPEDLVQMADYVSRIEKVKHPYDQGTKMRKGIEF